MAAYDFRRIEHIRHEYYLDSPAHWSEVSKAIASAQQDIDGTQTAQGDIWVESRGEEVVVYWDQKRKL